MNAQKHTRILYIGYWGANEGLSQATVMPHVKILCAFEQVERVIYASVERTGDTQFTLPDSPKLTHIPLRANRTPFRLLNKLLELTAFGRRLTEIAKKERIDLVICRSSLAGNWGLRIHRTLRIPFVVESFEPHADYMRELGIWPSWGPSYRYQRRMEEAQKREALHLYPVAENYKKHLIAEGVSAEKITTVPCGVDADVFAFNPDDRAATRAALGIGEDTTVGIYVGKFGGIYFSLKQAFALFREAYDHFNSFHLILLSPTSYATLMPHARASGYPETALTLRTVPHAHVPAYLSAADFAFSLHYPSPAMRFVSPIKNGEYWANGLPIVISEGIGDDSELVTNFNIGVVFGQRSSPDWTRVVNVVSLNDRRIETALLREFKISRSAYANLLNLNA